MSAIKVHKLLADETILPDDYPIHPGYIYIFDGVFDRTHPNHFESVTVEEYKARFGCKEIRRCNLFGHPEARLGDHVG